MATNAPPGQQRALAWSLLIAAVVWLVPANLLPIMSVTETGRGKASTCLLYTSPSPRDRTRSRMPSSA